jgi:hypothetical protein
MEPGALQGIETERLADVAEEHGDGGQSYRTAHRGGL